MKIVLLLVVIQSCVIHGMNFKNPAEVIRKHGLEPNSALNLLKQLEQIDANILADFRDESHNNLLHIIVYEVVKQKGSVKDYDKLQEEYKPLICHLVQSGVRVNELNDDKKAPLFIAYGNLSNQDDAEIIADYLHLELGAHPTYFSFEPQIRSLKRILHMICCCGCVKRKQA